MRKIILFFLFCLISHSNEKIYFKNNSTEISFGNNGEITEMKFNGENILKREGFLSIYDKGRKREIYKWNMINLKKEKERISFDFREKGNDLIISNLFEKEGEFIIWNLEIKNLEDEKKFIEVKINLPLKEKKWIFFDGRYEHKNIKNDIIRDEVNSTFPLSCVYDENYGIAIGITPEQYLSHLSSRFTSDNIFCYSTKIVIYPEKKEKIRFILLTFPSEFGYRYAIQKYYDTYPSFFSVHPEIDKKISGIESMSFPYTYYYPGMSNEILRRIKAGPCWCYGPWKREGDWYCNEELWDYKPVNEERAKRHYQWQVSASKFREWRKEKFLQLIPYDIGGYFYIWNGCETQLAEEKFKESIISEKPSLMTYHYETAHWMFSYGGKFGEFYQEGIKKVVEEIDGLSGFAIDSSGGMGNRKYYGKIIEEIDLPKSWDEKGPYLLEGVALAKNFEFIHSLKTKDGKYKCGVWINPAGEHPMPYMMVFRADRGMVEWRWINTYEKEKRELLDIYRLLMGRKPIGIHTTLRRDILENINWRQFSKEEIIEAYRGLWKHLIIAFLYYGILPSPDLIRGIPEMFELLPLLIEISEKGWEPLTAAKGPENILISRFGKDIKYFTFGNSTRENIKGEVKIMGKYFENFSPILTNWWEYEFESEIKNENTIFNIELLPREFMILRSLIGYRGDGIKIKTREIKKADNIEIDIKFLKTYGDKHKFIIHSPDGYFLPSLKLNGKGINLKDKEIEIKIKEGDNLIIKFLSEKIKTEEKKILEFPYEESVVIISSEDEKLFANWISEYFKFWYKYGVGQPKDVLIPIKTKEELDKYKIILRKGDSEVKIEDKNLIISGKDTDDLKTNVKKLLEILDKKYRYYGKFHVSDQLWYYWDEPRKAIPETVEMLKYIGVYDNIFSLGEIKK